MLRSLFDRPYALLLLTTACWGANANAGKLAVGVIDPLLLTQSRWVITALLALGLARKHVVTDWPLVKQHWRLLLGLSFLGFAGFNLFLYSALQFTTVLNVSIEQAFMPVLILMLSALVFKQSVSRWQMIGALVALCGVLVTITQAQWARLLTLSLNVGDVLMLVACLLYASYSLLLRNRPRLHPFSLMAVMSCFAAVSLLPFSLYAAWQQQLSMQWPEAVPIVLFVALFPSFLAQLFFIRSVDLMGANRAGLFINFVPIFGSVFAILLLNERFEVYHAVGLALVFGGIAMAEISGRQHTHA